MSSEEDWDNFNSEHDRENEDLGVPCSQVPETDVCDSDVWDDLCDGSGGADLTDSPSPGDLFLTDSEGEAGARTVQICGIWIEYSSLIAALLARSAEEDDPGVPTDDDEDPAAGGQDSRDDATLWPMQKVQAFLRPVSKASMSVSLLGIVPDAPALEQKQKQKRPRVDPLPPCNVRVTFTHGAFELQFTTEDGTTHRLRPGSILRLGGQLGVARTYTKATRQVHLQRLSTDLELHTGQAAEVKLPLISTLPDRSAGGPGAPPPTPTVLLLSPHVISLTLDDINHYFTRGQVNFAPYGERGKLACIMYCQSRGTCDVRDVPPDAPRFSDQHGCLNPWAVREASYRAGDWVELQLEPDGGDKVDCLTRLAAVVDHAPSGHGGGRGKENAGGHLGEAQAQGGRSCNTLDVRLYERRGTTAWQFVPGAVVKGVPRSAVVRRLDLEDLPPECEVLPFDDGSRAPLQDNEEGGSGDSAATCEAPAAPQLLPVIAADLFCGSGGVSTGMEQSGAALVKHAVDASRDALDTFRASHPQATGRVQVEDVCGFLTWWSQNEPEERVQLVVGGPPCQGFSKASSASAASRHDKNICVAVWLSAVEQIMPDYCCMENVAGLLAANGVAEAILRALVSLGYQCRLRLLNAGAYGVAQHRLRVIILAARHGLELPELPHPTHVFHAGGCTVAARRKAAMASVPRRWRANVVVPGSALLPRLSVQDVIGDLPPAAGVTASYTCAPATPFQAAARAKGEPLSQHVCPVPGEEVQRRLDAVPREGEAPPEGQARWAGARAVCEHPQRPPAVADWRDVPEALLPDSLKPPEKRDEAKLFGIMGRLTWDSHFPTLLTRATYSSTATYNLHPDARPSRVFTIRECARIQGVPDHVQLHGSITAAYRQVGNGVPPPLGAAIGRALSAARRRDAEAARGRPRGGGR